LLPGIRIPAQNKILKGQNNIINDKNMIGKKINCKIVQTTVIIDKGIKSKP
jgi:hypothetical protein